ncbi:MAG: hypothetical protein SFX73_38685 [Kofleriaceae bacterium]|nr:hypothetical protein [Kofleriaceae bacterium]
MAVLRAVKSVLAAIIAVVALVVGFAYAACRDQVERSLNEPTEAPKRATPNKQDKKRASPPKAEKDLPATR